MTTIIEKVTERGIEIPLEICKLAKLSDEAVIEVYEGRIEVKSANIPKERAEMISNKYLIMKLGDGLITDRIESSELDGISVWKARIVHSRTRNQVGTLYINKCNGVVLNYLAL